MSGRIGLIAGCAVLVGCLTGSVAGAAEFQFWHSLSGRHAQAVTALCDGFNRTQPQHRVSCAAQGTFDELIQKLIAAYRAHKQPALAMVAEAATAELLMSGAIEPISRLSSAEGEPIDWSQFIPGVIGYYATRSGAPLSQPFNVSTAVLFADRRRLAAVGVTALPESWEEALAVARSLKAAGDGCPMVLQTDHAWRLLEQSASAEGAQIATHENGFAGLGVGYLFDAGPHRRLMNDLLAAEREGLIVNHLATRSGRATQAFATGECAMSIESTASWGTIRAAKRVDAIVGLLPIRQGQSRFATFPGGASLWAMKGFDAATHRGVSAFLAYLRQPDQQAAFSIATGYLPVTRAGAERFLAVADPSDPGRAVVAAGLRSMGFPVEPAARGLRLGALVQIRKIWAEEVSGAFAGRRSMDEALARARQRADARARQFARTYPDAGFP